MPISGTLWDPVRRVVVALCVGVAVALVAASCGDPVVLEARSSDPLAYVTATPLPVEPTATPIPPPTPEPTPTPDPNADLTPEPSPTARPAPGLSPTAITLAFIYDDETGGTADGLFADALAGIFAWRDAVNAGGGISGRDIEVVHLDANLVNFGERLREVCEGEFFALVGTQSFGDAEVGSLLGSDACRLPNFPGEVYSAAHAVSPTTYLANPFLNDLRQAGPAQVLAEKFPEASENLALLFYDALQLQFETVRLREMLVGSGLTPTFEPTITLGEDVTESVVPAMAEAGVQSLWWNADPERLIALLEELEEPLEFVVCEIGCYSQRFINEGGEAVEGVRVWIPHRPFGDDAPDELINYQFFLNRHDRTIGWSEVGLKSWMAGRIFEDALVSLSEIEEVFTRNQLIEVAENITIYRARDLLSFTNPTAGEPTPCFALMVVQDGQWQQEHPPPGSDRDLDCDVDNLFRLTATADLGLTETSSISSDAPAPGGDADPDEPAEDDLENPEEIPE